MTKTIINFVVLSLVLLLAQIVCNKMMLLGIAMPIVYTYVILRLPVDWNKSWILTIAFFLGLAVDIFNDTPGMNAMAATIMATAREPVFYLCAPHDLQEDNLMPGSHSIGTANYVKYSFVLTLLFATVLYLIQAFTVHNIVLTLERIAASTALSVLLLLGIDMVVGRDS